MNYPVKCWKVNLQTQSIKLWHITLGLEWLLKSSERCAATLCDQSYKFHLVDDKMGYKEIPQIYTEAISTDQARKKPNLTGLKSVTCHPQHLPLQTLENT